jgi:hypothetical protein
VYSTRASWQLLARSQRPRPTVFAAVRGNWPWLTTETAIVEKPAEQADDHGHGHHHGHTH